jgi:hypothetical protein
MEMTGHRTLTPILHSKPLGCLIGSQYQEYGYMRPPLR